jgi:phosphatase NudJ
MPREPIPTWFFALVVVRRGNQFLVVHELEHGQRWFLPAGRAELGETLADATRRETLEETGIEVELEGVLRVQHTPSGAGARVRVIFLARPVDDTAPRSTPNDHSLEAAWVTLEELERLPLRGEEVRELFEQVAWGAPVYPLEVLGSE